MQQLLDHIEQSSPPKRLLTRLAPALKFFYEQISSHWCDQIAAENHLRKIQELYQSYSNEWPYQSGTAMKEFYSLHTDLLDVPVETSATRAILKFCHERLWPENLGFRGCDSETCIGHALPHSRLDSPRDSDHKRAEDRNILLGLVEVSQRQYSAYERL